MISYKKDEYSFWIFPKGRSFENTDHWLVTLRGNGTVFVTGVVNDRRFNPEFNEEFMAPYLDTLPRWAIETLADWAKKNDSN